LFDYHIISINPCKTTKLLNDLERNPQPFIDSYKNAISLLADLTDLYTILESDIKESHWRNLEVCYVSSPTGGLAPKRRYFRDKVYTEEERSRLTGYITENIE